MHGIRIFLISILVVLTQGSNSSQYPNWQSSWVMGGVNSGRGGFPFIAALRKSDTFEHFCAGSVINNWYILTAGHCVNGRTPSSFVAILGRVKPRAAGITRYDVSQIITHPNFHLPTYKDDIALIKVNQMILFKLRIKPVVLPSRGGLVRPETICLFAGWGKTTPTSGSYSNVLRQVELLIVSNTECQQVYPHMQANHICADPGPRKGLCLGDAGGPLMYGDRIVGVYIGGGAPGTVCSTPYPGIFINVAKYSDWIRSVVH